MVSKNFEKISLTFLGLGTNVVKISSVNSELLFQSDTLDHIQGDLRRAPQLQMVRGPTLEQGAQAELLRSIQLGHWICEGG